LAGKAKAGMVHPVDCSPVSPGKAKTQIDKDSKT